MAGIASLGTQLPSISASIGTRSRIATDFVADAFETGETTWPDQLGRTVFHSERTFTLADFAAFMEASLNRSADSAGFWTDRPVQAGDTEHRIARADDCRIETFGRRDHFRVVPVVGLPRRREAGRTHLPPRAGDHSEAARGLRVHRRSRPDLECASSAGMTRFHFTTIAAFRDDLAAVSVSI